MWFAAAQRKPLRESPRLGNTGFEASPTSTSRIAGLTAVAQIPAETRQGAKALDVVQRDSSYARLVQRLVSEEMSAESRALTIFEWTRKNIRDTPAGFPMVDDHVSHIKPYGSYLMGFRPSRPPDVLRVGPECPAG